jgi:lipopolysaccharide/colanic/teichoic acid biosynthesis glycosyltransferase
MADPRTRQDGLAEPGVTREAATFIADVTAGSSLLVRTLAVLATAALVGRFLGLGGAFGTVAVLTLLYLAWLPVRRRRRDQLRRNAFVWWGSAADSGAEENFFIKPWYGRGSGDVLPTYVPRTAMASLEEGLDDENGRFVILTGNPTSGKSRLVYEVARGRPGHVTFVAGGAPGAGAPDHLLELMEDPLGFSTWEERQILVLRDLRQRLIARNISAGFMADWLDRHPKVAVVATLDSEDFTRIGDDGEETVAELAGLEDRAKVVEVKDYLEGDELADAHLTFPDLTDEQLTWLPSYLVSANFLRDKLQGTDAMQHPVGVAIVRASVDWQRAGVARPAPEHFLRQVVRQYAPGVPSEDSGAVFEEELRWALEPVQGAAALLYRVDPEGPEEGFRADGVVVERIEAAEPPNPVPRPTWDAIRDEVTDFSGRKSAADRPAAELIGMAEAAQRAGLGEMGRELLKLAGKLASGSQYRRIAEVFTASSARGPALRSLLDGRYDDGFRYRMRASREQNHARRRRVEGEGRSIRGHIVSEIYSHRWWRAVIRFAVLVTVDLASSALGILLGLVLRSLVEVGGVHPGSLLDDLSRSLIFVWIAITIALFALRKLYKEDAERARLGEILATMGMLGLIGFGAAVAAELSFEAMLTAFLIALMCVVVSALFDFELRRKYDEVSTKWVERNELKARTLLIGSAQHAAEVEELLEGGISRPTEVVGYMAADPTEEPGQGFLGSLEDPDNLAAVALRHDIARVLIADPEMTVREREDLADLCHLRGLKVEAVPTIADVRAGSVRLAPGQPLVLMELDPLWLGNAAYAAKRTLDVTLTLLSAPIVVPLCIWAALRIALFGGGRPIVADSWRPGVGMRIFGMRRFRTQSGDFRSPIDAADRGDDRAQHLTVVGAKLGSRGFDVLPQLLNVLTGKMSLVGPRPLHLSDHAKLADEHLLRYVIRPGVTGPWQVCNREKITCSELTKMDLAYLRNWTVLSDLEILIKTARMMIKGSKPLQLLVPEPEPRPAVTGLDSASGPKQSRF